MNELGNELKATPRAIVEFNFEVELRSYNGTENALRQLLIRLLLVHTKVSLTILVPFAKSNISPELL